VRLKEWYNPATDPDRHGAKFCHFDALRYRAKGGGRRGISSKANACINAQPEVNPFVKKELIFAAIY